VIHSGIMWTVVGNDDRIGAEGLGLAVAYGLVSALIVFMVSTAVTSLVANGHGVGVWLTSALVITVISCAVSGPVLSYVSRRSRSAASRYLWPSRLRVRR
jgi:predicted Co/Zn/Cd cation transporter (cation efflux family)